MMRSLMRLCQVGILVTLLLTLTPLSGAAQDATEDQEAAPVELATEQLLRRATDQIRYLDLQLGFYKNRVVERDSLLASQERAFLAEQQRLLAWGDHWQGVATSWWRDIKLALAALLGMLAAAWAQDQ